MISLPEVQGDLIECLKFISKHLSYLNVIIDCFGDNVILSETDDEECFQAVFKAAVSPTFLLWIIGFGAGALVLSPQWVADEVNNLALEAAEMYDENS